MTPSEFQPPTPIFTGSDYTAMLAFVVFACMVIAISLAIYLAGAADRRKQLHLAELNIDRDLRVAEIHAESERAVATLEASSRTRVAELEARALRPGEEEGEKEGEGEEPRP